LSADSQSLSNYPTLSFKTYDPDPHLPVYLQPAGVRPRFYFIGNDTGMRRLQNATLVLRTWLLRIRRSRKGRNIEMIGLVVSRFGTASNFTGWTAEGQHNFNRCMGLAADPMACPLRVRNDNLQGLPKATGYRFLVGPVLSCRKKSRITPFAHVLVGYDRASLNATTIGYLRISLGDCSRD
jgi:hypothetical protein